MLQYTSPDLCHTQVARWHDMLGITLINGSAARCCCNTFDCTCEWLPQVNKIREVPHHESVLVTHTDQAEVFVWSLERQPNRASDKVLFLH